MNTHNVIVDFGKHKGERWTRIPINYLQWLVNEGEGEPKRYAQAELARRGIVVRTDLVLSAHAIDRASQISHNWRREGVWTWLARVANEALIASNGETEIEHKGFRFIFAFGEWYPTLKTIIKLR